MNTPDNNNNKLMVKSIHTRNAMIDHDYDLEDFQYEIPRKVARWSGAVLIAVTAITILALYLTPSPYLKDGKEPLINHVVPKGMKQYECLFWQQIKPKPTPEELERMRQEQEARWEAQRVQDSLARIQHYENLVRRFGKEHADYLMRRPR